MLEAIYFVSQSIAAIGVLGSLYFVAVQIRQNTRAIRAASRHENDMDWARLNYDLANNPKIARLFALLQDSDASIESLDPDDMVALQLIFRSVIMTFQAHYFLSREGSLPKEHWLFERDYARRLIRTPIGSIVYQMEIEQGSIRHGFKDEIEGDAEVGVFDLGPRGVREVLSKLETSEKAKAEKSA